VLRLIFVVLLLSLQVSHYKISINARARAVAREYLLEFVEERD